MKMDAQHHSLASSRSLRKLLMSHPQRSGDQESSQQGSDVREGRRQCGGRRGSSLCGLVGSCVARHQAGKCLNMAVRKGLRRWWHQGRDNQNRNQQEANRDS